MDHRPAPLMFNMLQSPKNLRKQTSARKLSTKKGVPNLYERRLYAKTVRIGRVVRRYFRAALALLVCWFAVKFARDPDAFRRARATLNSKASTLSEKVRNWTALEKTFQEFQKSTTMALWAALHESSKPSPWTPETVSPESSPVNAHPFEESQRELSQPAFWHQIVSGLNGPAEAFTCPSDAGDTSTSSEPVFIEAIRLQGAAPDTQFGRSIALSGDGSILAVGAPFHNDFASEAGRVGVYQLVGNSAHVLFEFSGNQVGLRVGQSLSMSRTSPPILAIAGTEFVNVYPISQFLNGEGGGSDEWVLAFDRFEADFINEDYGSAISISGDGTRLAVGAPRTSNGSEHVGMVQVYLIGTGQIGPEILGLDENDFFGSAVSLSEDGSTVAAGSFTGASSAGYAKIFRQSGHNWDQVGQTIRGQQPGDNLGRSISISADGQTVAIGAFQAEVGAGAGYVQVYQFDGTTWIQVGENIVGPKNGDRFGVSMALTPDASFVTIGANAHDSGGFIKNGLFQVYENQSGTWTKVGGDIVGNADSRNLGVGLAISSDGRTVAAGGPLSTATQDTNVGEAVIYDL
jgi:hypothetical protein